MQKVLEEEYFALRGGVKSKLRGGRERKGLHLGEISLRD